MQRNCIGLLRRGFGLPLLQLRRVRARRQLPSGATRAMEPLRHVRILAVDLRPRIRSSEAPVPLVQIRSRAALLVVAFRRELLRVYGRVQEEAERRGAATWQPSEEDEAGEKCARARGGGGMEECTCEEAGGT